MSERPTLRSNRSAIEGMSPLGSSSEMRSTRCMGKNAVGRPTRSPSGCRTCRTKSSNEFRSMPRIVTPEEFRATISPHTFSELLSTLEEGEIRANASSTGVERPKELILKRILPILQEYMEKAN